MFIAHFGFAMAARRVAPQPAFGTLLLAAMLVDGIWPVFVLLEWERVEIVPGITAVTPLLFASYPYTHSLLFGALWAALLGGGYYTLRRDRGGALWLAALVLSHWVLDFAAHRPDMPLWPGGPKVGLGLWYSLPGTLVVEFAIFDPEEIALARVNVYRVLLDRGSVAERMAAIASRVEAPPSRDWLIGQMLTLLLVGLLRAQRGELMSARAMLGKAVQRFAALQETSDNLDPLRRFEQLHPELAAKIEAAMRLDAVQTARALLEIFAPFAPERAIEAIRK